jgi:hypothetical protein
VNGKTGSRAVWARRTERTQLELRDLDHDLRVAAGDGGNGGGGSNLGTGGNGGALTGVTAQFIGSVDEDVFFLAGIGGNAGTMNGAKSKGGTGGAASAITVANYGSLAGNNNTPHYFFVSQAPAVMGAAPALPVWVGTRTKSHSL